MGSAAGAARARDAKRAKYPQMAQTESTAEQTMAAETVQNLPVVDLQAIPESIQGIATAHVLRLVPDSVRLIGKTIRNSRASLPLRCNLALKVLDMAGVGIKPGAGNGPGVDLSAIARAVAMQQAKANAVDAVVIESAKKPMESVEVPLPRVE